MSASDLGAFSVNVKNAFRGRRGAVGALDQHYHHTTCRRPSPPHVYAQAHAARRVPQDFGMAYFWMIVGAPAQTCGGPRRGATRNRPGGKNRRTAHLR